MMVRVCKYNECGPLDSISIDTTSRSKNWSRGLSPFFLGPVKLPNGSFARNVENAWQFAKVYPEHISDFGDPNGSYWQWAQAGWNSTFAHRYPRGKGAKPVYSYWNGEHLSYINARKKIYIPLYSQAVCNTDAFKKLRDLYQSGTPLWLRDFDGYNHKKLGMSYDDVINCETRKMGHAFVLAMMLEGYLDGKDAK